MLAHDALRTLRAAGVSADAVDARTLRVDGDHLEIATTRSAPTRADADRALGSVGPERRVLVLADKLTPSLSMAALDDERIVVVSKNTVIRNREMVSLADEPNVMAARPTGRRPYARFALARALLAADGPTTQQQLVTDLGVSQSSASKALSTSLFDGVLTRRWGGVEVADRGELFDRVVTQYPGPGGVATYWWSESPILQQAQSVAGADETVLLSGDVAADAISAWRRPEHAVAYTRGEPDLRRLGFSMADPDDYTLMLIYPDDKTLWSTARVWTSSRIADPMTVSYDVTRTGTLGDQDEAVDRIKNYVIERTR